MNKKKLIVLIILALLLFVSVLTWGKTVRVAKANRFLVDPAEPDGTAKARQVYEDLLVDLPRSPYLLHNMGLTFYRDGSLEEAAEHFQSAGEELEKTDINIKQRRNLAHKFHYHQGNAWFSAAESALTNEEAVAVYEKALAHFQQAIKANPADHDSKYNYELTLLRLEQAESETNPDKEEQQEGEEDRDKEDPLDKEGDKENQEASEEINSGNSTSTDAEPKNQQEIKGKDTDMSKEEAINLLETMESGVLYQGPLFPDAPSAGKDW